MFCPQCGLRQAANDVRFCSSCGFQLNVVSDLLTTGGVLTPRALTPAGPRKLSPRSKGMRQGAMMMLSTMLIVPLVAIIFYGLMGLPGEIVALAAVSCFAGGLLRIIYAALFEDRYAPDEPSAYAPADARLPAAPTRGHGRGHAPPPERHREHDAPARRPAGGRHEPMTARPHRSRPLHAVTR